jgi:hypothetical protein
MPHVTDNIDILEHTPIAFERSETLPQVQPPSRRGGFRLYAVLRRWLTFARAQRTLRVQQHAPNTRQFELPLDILARKYPDLYMRTMTGSG